jgi:hypothetical protein
MVFRRVNIHHKKIHFLQQLVPKPQGVITIYYRHFHSNKFHDETNDKWTPPRTYLRSHIISVISISVSFGKIKLALRV